MASDAGNHRERQRRELDEIRRSFHERGPTGDALFEPARQNGSSGGRQALPAPPAPATAGGRLGGGRPVGVVALVALVVAGVLAGGGLGYLLHRPAAGPAGPVVAPVVTRAEPQPQPQPQPRTRTVAPPACLQTAQRGDQVIDLFTRNVRDQRLSLALKAYTDASQACRKEASP